MLRFIRDKTAAPYFSNLVWFIGDHIAEIDRFLTGDCKPHNLYKLADLVAEHLDHIHYVNDILILNIDCLNEVLTEHLSKRLLVPLYLGSLAQNHDGSRVSKVVALFLLSQVSKFSFFNFFTNFSDFFFLLFSNFLYALVFFLLIFVLEN